MLRFFEYTYNGVEYTAHVDLKATLDEEGDEIVTEITVISGMPFTHQPYAKEDILASIHGLGIRLYDDYKFNF